MPPALHPLRIILATGVYAPDRGGASEWLRNYARWLVERGHQVCVACEQAETRPPGSCALLALPASQHATNSWRRAGALQRLVIQSPADVVHDTGCLMASDVFHPLMGSLIHNWYRQLRAFPPALRLRRFWHVRLWRDVRLQLHQMRHHRRLVACSKRVASDFAWLGCRTQIIIPNGIRLPAASTEAAIQSLRQKLGGSGRLLALVTANNFYLKGVNTVLRALSLLDAGIRRKLLVVITGHNRNGSFQQYIDQHGMGDACRLTGWVADIDEYYQAADIFLHPTYHDAGSLSTLKALAAGCAVVTSRYDGSADLIRDGREGLILDRPGDAGELAGIMTRLLDGGLRHQLGVAARQLVPAISQEHNFQRLEELSFGLVEGRISPL